MTPFAPICILLTINAQPYGCAPGPIQYFNADSPRYIRSGPIVVQSPRVRFEWPVMQIDRVVLDRVFSGGFE